MAIRELFRKCAVVALAAATFAPAAYLPVVDAGEPVARAQVERSHEPGRCHYQHDHTLCVQFFGSAAHPEPVAGHLPAERVQTFRLHAPAEEVFLPFTGTHHLARSPPVALG